MMMVMVMLMEMMMVVMMMPIALKRTMMMMHSDKRWDPQISQLKCATCEFITLNKILCVFADQVISPIKKIQNIKISHNVKV